MIDLLQLVWRPLLEILIMSVGIYYGFILVRGTKGAPVVTGFLTLMLALTAVTIILELSVLRWMLGTFFAFSLVAVLVLFQPELRRILAEVGNTSLFSTVREQRENIEVIVQTCERLAEVRIGAIIAIEQSIHLHEVVESGIIVDCQATPEMLEAIFFPNNAIHDGGVILIGDRIAYAACIFPLTQRQDLSKSLGTRHRAGIGLSEETDAVVVLVSEENGAISYAYRGQLTKGVTLEELRAFLTSIFITRSRRVTRLDSVRFWFANRHPAPAPVKAEADKSN